MERPVRREGNYNREKLASRPRMRPWWAPGGPLWRHPSAWPQWKCRQTHLSSLESRSHNRAPQGGSSHSRPRSLFPVDPLLTRVTDRGNTILSQSKLSPHPQEYGSTPQSQHEVNTKKQFRVRALLKVKIIRPQKDHRVPSSPTIRPGWFP